MHVLRIEVPLAEAEVVADALWAAGASAVGEELVASGAVVLTADLAACPSALAGWPHEVGVDDGAWRDGWRPHAKAVIAGPFLVRPPWLEVDVPAGCLELVLDGGRAFGTGSHPSTTLALAALAGVVQPGGSVLDVGCGSGSLAVGAALLGAVSVVAVDVDPEAITATAANADLNGVAGTIEVRRVAAEDVEGAFDVVVANLGAPLVYDLAGSFVDRCAPGGSLVLSGLFGARHDERVVAAYPGAEIVDITGDEGWSCTVLRPR